MSSFDQLWSEANQGQFGVGPAWESLKEKYPTLAEVLLGRPSSRDDGGRPKCKVLIFAEADKLKFLISPESGSQVAFGTFSEPRDGFDNLEHEIREKRVEWKKRKRMG